MTNAALRALPSVDQLLRNADLAPAIERFGRALVTTHARELLAEIRTAVAAGASMLNLPTLTASLICKLEVSERSSLRPLLNLTGTVLHTNLGRALLAEAAIEAAVAAMREAVALEFDLHSGRRGERDDHICDLICELTGAEDVTLVNNNAAAVLIALNTLSAGREAIVSRGELIEIGGAFRMPDIMARAGVQLVEVGTTNRTHAKDYKTALGPQTGLVLKVHTSNYRIQGFTAEVSGREVAKIAHAAGVPLMNDLGSGTLIDLSRWGLAREPTVRDAIEEGADIVTFSGDKLLGGPQAGFIAGRKDLIAAINRNPMKRALRVDKIRIAALAATLRLYRDPDRLAERLPTLQFLSRPEIEIRAMAERLLPHVTKILSPDFEVEVCACKSQIGSGALPLDMIPSAGLRIKTPSGSALERLTSALRALPRPILGHVTEGALVLDLRCLLNEEVLIESLSALPSQGLQHAMD